MPEDPLYDLIHSLSPHEKGYIRRMVAANVPDNESQYLRLFNALDELETYDEQQLREKFGEEKFLRNLAAAKAYLFTVLLRQLENYHQSPQAEVRSLITQYYILRAKGFAPAGYKLLKKALQICEKNFLDYPKEELLFTMMSHNMKFDNSEQSLENSTEIFEKIREIQDANREAARLRLELEKVKSESRTIIRARTEEKAEYFRRKAEVLLQYDVSRLLSFDARYQYYQLLSNCYYVCNEHEKCLYWMNEFCNWLRQHESAIDARRITFASVYYNKGLCEIQLFDKGISQTLRDLESIVNFGSADQIEIETLYRRLHILFLWEVCRYSELLVECETVLKLIEGNRKPTSFLSGDLFCYFMKGCALFALGQHAEASKQFQLVLTLQNHEMGQAHVSVARVVLLILAFERGDRIGLDSAILATYRYLARKDSLHKTEKAILDFLRFTSRHVFDDAEMQEELTRFREKIREINADPNEETGSRLFDLEAWLNSRIDSVSFAEARLRLAAEKWKTDLGSL